MPSRILREGINSSDRVNALSPGAEILYRRLMSVVDDYGRYYGSPATVRAGCWPVNPEAVCEQDVGKWLAECQQGERPLVTVYRVGNAVYLQLNDFNQKVRSKSKFPQPASSLSAECPQVADKTPALGVVRISNCDMRISTKCERTFARLYERHPKKQNKVLAEQALAMALLPIPDDQRDQLLEKIEAAHEAMCKSADWTKKNGQFAPFLNRWLTDRGWEDTLPASNEWDGY